MGKGESHERSKVCIQKLNKPQDTVYGGKLA